MGSVAGLWMKIIQFTSIKSLARTQKERGTRGGEWILAGSISWQVRDKDVRGIQYAFHARILEQNLQQSGTKWQR